MVGRARAWPAALALLLIPAAADLIFRVPEVLVRHAAVPRPVGTGQPNRSEPWAAGTGILEVHYEEYFVEHDVSTTEARNVARALNLDEIPESRAGCGVCSKRELQYCETRVLADHCCCERRFVPEPFPWLPHTCYAGRARCRPLAHDCAQYARLRDCCCYRQLAERWKGILSRSGRAGAGGAWLLLAPLLLASV